MKIKYKKLKNGLHFVSASNLQAQSVSIGIAFFSGANVETPKNYGIAHALEHVVLKGTKSFPTEEKIREYLDEFGGILNARTSRYYTVFAAKVPKIGVKKAWHLLTSLVTEPLINPRSIKEELNIISHEIDRFNSNLNYQKYRLLCEGIFGKNHPLVRDIIGTKKEIFKLVPGDFLNYIQNYYTCNNAGLFFVGAISKKEAERLGNELAKKLPIGLKINQKQKRVIPADKFSKKNIRKKMKITQEKIAIGIPIVPSNNPNLFIFELAATMLGAGTSSPLMKTLRKKQQLIYTATVLIDRFFEQSNFVIETETKIGQSRKVIREIFKLLENFSKDKDRFKIGKKILLNRLVLKSEDTLNFLYFLVYRLATKKRPFIYSEYAKKINQIKYDNFRKIISQYIKAKRATTVIISPKK